MSISIMDIDRIDESRMEFSIQAYFKEEWSDWRLNMTPFFEGMNQRRVLPHIFADSIWKPDLVFDNAKSGILFSLSIPNTYISGLPSGQLQRESRFNLVISCQMNFVYYPMDTQLCFLKLALLSNPDDKVTLHWSDEEHNPRRSSEAIKFMNEIEALKYKLEVPKPYKTKEEWDKVNFTYLYANFTFIRRISGSLLNVYIPSTLVVCLSWISFWLDVSAAPARVTLGATSLLTLVTQMMQARNGLPPISYMTAMDIWLFACLFTVFSSLLAYAFTYHVSVLTKKKSTQGLQQQVAQPDIIESKHDLRCRRSPRIVHSNQIVSNIVKTENSAKTTWGRFIGFNLDTIWRVLFPLLFTMFAIMYWTYFLWCV